MVFFSAPLLARAAKRVGFLKLTTKRARKGYYKGKGAIPTGKAHESGCVVATRRLGRAVASVVASPARASTNPSGRKKSRRAGVFALD